MSSRGIRWKDDCAFSFHLLIMRAKWLSYFVASFIICVCACVKYIQRESDTGSHKMIRSTWAGNLLPQASGSILVAGLPLARKTPNTHLVWKLYRNKGVESRICPPHGKFWITYSMGGVRLIGRTTFPIFRSKFAGRPKSWRSKHSWTVSLLHRNMNPASTAVVVFVQTLDLEFGLRP